MTVILVFNSVPEEVEVYRFDEPDLATLGLLRRSHRYYIHAVDEIQPDVAEFLCNLPPDKRIYADHSPDADDRLKFASAEVEIIVSGILL